MQVVAITSTIISCVYFYMQEAYFTLAKDRHEASGYIENRLKNIRRREPRDLTTLTKTVPAKKVKLVSEQIDMKCNYSIFLC